MNLADTYRRIDRNKIIAETPFNDGEMAAAIRETISDLEAFIAKAESMGLRVSVKQTSIAVDHRSALTVFDVDIARPI